jgi:hypothetical protein
VNRFYKAGIQIGATPKTPSGPWTLDQYKELARNLWKGIPETTPYAVVEIARDGGKFLIGPFQSKSDAADRYGTSTGNPQWAVYIAFFDRTVKAGEDTIIDEAFFQPTDIIETRTERVPFAVKAGLGLGAVLGLLALVAKH